MGPRAILRMTVVTGLALVMFTGCSTLGGGDTKNTVRATYQKVAKIEKNLDGPVAQLNTTAAALTARVEASEEKISRIGSTVDENQRKLADIEKKIDNLSVILHRMGNLTGPAGVGRPPSEVADPAAPIVQTPGAAPSLVPQSAAPQSAAPTTSPGTLAPPVASPAMTTPLGATPEATAATPGRTAQPEAFKMGKGAYTNRDYAGAIRLFNDCIQQSSDPDTSADAQFWKAKCYQKLEKYPDAIKEFESVRTTYPKSAKAITAMHEQAVCLAKNNDKEAAKALFRKLMTDYPMANEATLAKTALQTLEGTAATTR